jgi:hypothetical protein
MLVVLNQPTNQPTNQPIMANESPWATSEVESHDNLLVPKNSLPS